MSASTPSRPDETSPSEPPILGSRIVCFLRSGLLVGRAKKHQGTTCEMLAFRKDGNLSHFIGTAAILYPPTASERNVDPKIF